MRTQIDRRKLRRRSRHRIRRRLRGSAVRPRVAVFRSQRHIYVQAIDDDSGRTVAQASTCERDFKGKLAKSWDIGAAQAVGTALAERLKSSGIDAAVFDRGGYVFRGRVKALADAARAAGLKF